jgi:hypothetical protein
VAVLSPRSKGAVTIVYHNGGDQLLPLDELRTEVAAGVADLPPETLSRRHDHYDAHTEAEPEIMPA